MAKLVAVQTAGSFYSDLGGRIYLIEGDQDAALPQCVVTPVATTVEREIGNHDSRTALYQIDLWDHWTNGHEVLGDINTKLFTLLQGATITPTGFDRGVVTCREEAVVSREEDWWRIMSEWVIEGTDFA